MAGGGGTRQVGPGGPRRTGKRTWCIFVLREGRGTRRSQDHQLRHALIHALPHGRRPRGLGPRAGALRGDEHARADGLVLLSPSPRAG